MSSRLALVIILVAFGSNVAAAPPDAPPAAAAPAKSVYERLRDTDGKVAGLAGFSIKRKASKNHCGGFAIITTRGKKVAKDDEPLVAVYKLEFPKGLNFNPDPKHKKQKEASLEKFNKFLEEIHKVGGDANTYYEHKLIGDGDPALEVAAAARIAQLQTRIASVLARAEIPADVRTGEFADDKVKAFCDKLVEVAEPLQARAELAISACADKAKNVGAGWWNEVCVP